MDIWIILLLAITNNATINICVQKKKKIALCFLKGPGKKKKNPAGHPNILGGKKPKPGEKAEGHIPLDHFLESETSS